MHDICKNDKIIEMVREDLQEIKRDMKEIKKELLSLTVFKYQIIGVASFFGAIAGIVSEWIRK